jgi:hypothetical protein
VHYGVEEITVNIRKMLKKNYWTYSLIWRSLKVALNRSIILKYVLLRAKKVGHQISVSFEKFDVVQPLLSFF